MDSGAVPDTSTCKALAGGELASTDIEKSYFYSVRYRRDGSKKVNANKKFVPANDNDFMPALQAA